MKKLQLTVALGMLAVASQAANFQIDGLSYATLTSNTVSIAAVDTTSVSGDLIIPSTVTNNGTTYTVTAVASRGFQESRRITSVTIPQTITTLNSLCFESCYGLSSLTIPATVTVIGDGIANNCRKLENISVSEDNPNYCDVDGVLFKRDMTRLIQYPAAKAGDYTIPDGVEVLGISSFRGCSNLTAVSFPESVTAIRDYSFCNCTSLTSITIPEGCTKIYPSSFYGCRALESVSMPQSIASIDQEAFSRCLNLKSITLPEGLTTIGINAFSQCQSLKGISIPASVTSIDPSSFSLCGSLAEINVAADNPSFIVENDALLNKEKTVIYKLSVEFTGEFTIPETVQTLATCSFYNTPGLTNVSIPESTDLMGTRVFLNCPNLQDVEIPSKISIVKLSTFENCARLKYARIPQSTTELADRSFYGCSNLKTIVTLNPTPPALSDSTFFAVPQNATIFVPKGSLDVYKTDWSQFSDIREINDGLIVNIDRTQLTLIPGEQAQLSAEIHSINGTATTTSQSWKSSDSNVATVSDTGLVTAIVEGTSEITLTVTDSDSHTYTAACQVTVSDTTSSIGTIKADRHGLYNIFTISGHRIKENASIADLHNLRPGLYIINGIKVIIR